MKWMMLCVLLATGACCTVPNDLPSGGICAHRGDLKCFPENTVPAFRSAVEKGAAMVEFDVKKCKTGEYVIMHDATIDRTTTGTGKVSDLTFAELRAVDAGVKKDPKFAGTKIPTFEEALDCLPKSGVLINIHCGTAALPLARIVKAKGRLHQAYFSTGIKDGRAVRAEIPDALICNMSRTKKGVAAYHEPWTDAELRLYAQQTVDNGFNALQHLCPCNRSDSDLVHAAGGKVAFFHSEKPAQLKDLLDRGIDFVLTNDLDAMLAEYRRLAAAR